VNGADFRSSSPFSRISVTPGGIGRSPGFTTVAVITLAVAIGINGGVFTIAGTMLFLGVTHKSIPAIAFSRLPAHFECRVFRVVYPEDIAYSEDIRQRGGQPARRDSGYVRAAWCSRSSHCREEQRAADRALQVPMWALD
jgi:hypothetical protein